MTRQRGNTALMIGGMLLDDDDLFNDASWKSPTLEFDFTTEGPFEPQYVCASTEGYRMIDGKLERWIA